MNKYNIIYITPDETHYLWTPRSLDKLEDDEREVLLYSGASVTESDLNDALNQCREAVKQRFPNDANPEIKTVEVSVP